MAKRYHYPAGVGCRASFFGEPTDIGMNEVGVYNEFYVQEGVGHTIDLFSQYDGQNIIDANLHFLAQHLVPEPSSWVLFGAATVALLVLARRKTRGVAARN